MSFNISQKFAAVITAAKSFLILTFFNSVKRRRQRLNLALRQLAGDIMDCLMVNDYLHTLYLHERRIHKAKIKCMYWLTALGCQTLQDENAELYVLLLDAGQIRRRVTDHTIFGLCMDELKLIRQALLDIFSNLGSDRLLESVAALNIAIQAFDDNYEHVLKVASREPIVFVLFQGSLRNLVEVVKRVANDG